MNFELEFDVKPDDVAAMAEEDPVEEVEASPVSVVPPPRDGKPSADADKEKAAEDEGEKAGAQVVSLDSFRKK